MSGAIEFSIDVSGYEKELKKLDSIKNGTKIASTRAINRTVAGMKTDAKKLISQNYHIMQKESKSELIVEKASYGYMVGSLKSKGRPIRSIKFKHKPDNGNSAVFLNVKKSEPGGYLNGTDVKSKAFIATMHNGTAGIFQRTGARVSVAGATKAAMRKNKSHYFNRTFKLRKGKKRKGRENIEQLRSVGVTQMLNNEGVRDTIQKNAAERFKKELDHQVKYLLSKN